MSKRNAATLAKPLTIDVAYIARAYESVLAIEDEREREAEVAKVAAAIDALPDEDTVNGVHMAHLIEQNAVAPYRWARELFEGSLERRLAQRRAERGGDAPIAIPHPAIEVVNEVQYGPYDLDAEVLEAAAATPLLSDEERAKLVVVTPEHVIPAQVVPRTVRAGNAQSVLAIARRYAGSALGTMIASAVTRKPLGSRTTIRPKKAAPPKRVAR